MPNHEVKRDWLTADFARLQPPLSLNVRASIPPYGFLYCQVLILAHGKYSL